MVEAQAEVRTLLFTDIVGSTRLWESHPERMGEALARHNEIMRRAIEAEGGLIFKTMGDAFCASFSHGGGGPAGRGPQPRRSSAPSRGPSP